MLFPSQIVDYEYDCIIGKELKKIRIGEIKTKYTVIIFYPLDFTFVCPTEITKFSDLYDEFVKLDVTILFSSCDSVYSHLNWINMSRENGGVGEVKWPMISDICHKLCSQFNLFDEESGTTMRSTVILDKSKKAVHLSANINPVGRSSIEILRLIKALDFHESNGDVCFVDFEGK
ncbi:uncharacterized protein VICG_00498 [Vittaforma corneae ATCC 50505]|uniref:Thioredoxin domain-containing protein n=1 Tax=Vittaforma corneae (strain ATCC 50505) TaxID=993615 RepID=L2GP40_VITCO|nr:uncharacterized protein VICG_00498 [Vittaforma corneae ATCC 50505]ELA42399.1 hypothetical protein VICG_00498 [Vittaforma corneae ATCC 50505]